MLLAWSWPQHIAARFQKLCSLGMSSSSPKGKLCWLVGAVVSVENGRAGKLFGFKGAILIEGSVLGGQGGWLNWPLN